MRDRFLNASVLIICFWPILLFFSALNLHSRETKVQVMEKESVLRLEPKKESPPLINLPLGGIAVVEGVERDWLNIRLPLAEQGFVDIEPKPAPPLKKIEEKVEEKKLRAAAVPPLEAKTKEKEERRPVFGLGISAGYALPSEGIYDGGVMFSGRICFSIVKNIGIEIKGLMHQSSVEEEPEGLSAGKLTIAPIQLSLLGRFPLGEKLVPYTGLGAGYYLSRFKVDNEIADNWSNLGFDIEEKIENTLGFHFVVGVDYFFTRNLALNADISYCSVKPKGSWSLTDQVSGTSVSEDFEDLNFSSILFGIGLKYFF